MQYEQTNEVGAACCLLLCATRESTVANFRPHDLISHCIFGMPSEGTLVLRGIGEELEDSLLRSSGTVTFLYGDDIFLN